MSAPELQYAEVDGSRLAYVVGGSPDAPPLVLLQRFRGTIHDWDPALIESLSAHRRVIRFDSAGVGNSTGDVPKAIGGMAAVAAAFVRELGLSEVDLLGWSLGGYIAQIVALDHPQLVRRLVVAGSGPGGVSEGRPPHPHVAEIALKPQLSDDDLVFLFSSGSEDSGAAMMAAAQRSNASGNGVPVTIEAAVAQRAAITRWWKGDGAARARLADLCMRVLVANGVSDRMIPAFHSFVISQEAPDAKLVLYPDAGHGFLFQHQVAFAAEVEAFLA